MAKTTGAQLLWSLLRTWIVLQLVLAAMQTLARIVTPNASGVGIALDRASHVVWAVYAFRRVRASS